MHNEASIPAGYKYYQGVSPAEDNVGPFYYRKHGDAVQMGMRATEKHANGVGSVHGGVLLCYADYAATMLALNGVKENCVTISLNSDFLAAARIGDWIEGSGEVIKRTGSLTFIRGELSVSGSPVLGFQSVLRRLAKKEP
jgi:uncharacterized protein (TIGR00369 family)